MSAKQEEFITLLIDAQVVLYPYILSHVGNDTITEDILQETNVVLWRKWEQFEIGSNFLAWAKKIAHFQVLSFIKKNARNTHVFNDEVLASITRASAEFDSQKSLIQDALKQCVAKLSPTHHQMVHQRYYLGESYEKISETHERSITSIYQAMHRIRQALVKCINQVVSGERA